MTSHDGSRFATNLSSRPEESWAFGPPKVMKPSVKQPLFMEAPPSPLSSRAYPDFLLAALERPARAVFCKENRMKLATPPTSTGNPGQPRDLQFCGPFLEMFSTEAPDAVRDVVVLLMGTELLYVLHQEREQTTRG
jgi:hypothetical protein